jgi:Zn-dependent peptidase ImmA (M78 family)
MAIIPGMTKMTFRSTFAPDRETVAALDRLAEKWGVSKSEALRRIIDAGALPPDHWSTGTDLLTDLPG